MTSQDPKLGRLPWASHPWPRDDELFTSWLIRFAAANTVTPRRLLAFLAGVPVTGINFRAVRFHDHLETFSKVSGIPVERLAAMFPAWSENSPHYWARGLSYKCCPQCLHTDDVPYLRVSWTDPKAVLCLKHRSPLSVRCSTCEVHWELKVFGISDRPEPRDLLHCRRHSNQSLVMFSELGTLAPDHGAMWLQRELEDPDRAGLAELPDGRKIERRLLRRMLGRLPHSGLRHALLPFEVEDGLRQDRNWSDRRALHPWLLFAQLLVQPPWIWSEILTSLAEQLRAAMGTLLPNGKILQVGNDGYHSEASMLLFFHLMYDPEVLVIDHRALATYDFTAVLREQERFLGLDSALLLSQLPQYVPGVPER